MSIPDNAFVLGTMEGEPIPLSAARAKYSKAVVIANGSTTDIIMPEDVNLVTFYGTADFEIIHLNTNLPTIAGWDTETFRAIKNIFYDMFTPKNIRIVGRGSGVVTLNCLVRWAAVSNEGKYNAS